MPVNSTAESYARAIAGELLDLRLGDALSINTDEEDLEFAKLVANTALGLTDVTVKIVVTKEGRPVNVLEFDPAPPAHMPKGAVMLRLRHVKRRSAVQGHVLDIAVDRNDLGVIQKFGHLAEPVVLNRRIAVPWCVADVFDAGDPAWEAVERKIGLSVSNQGLAARYRNRRVSEAGIRNIILRGEGFCLNLDVPEGTLFTDGAQTLSSGREFLSTMDFDRISFNVDRASAEGNVRAFLTALGVEQEADLVFRDGLLADWTHTPSLDRLIAFDENLRRPGFISLMDNEICLNLGGALVEALDNVPDSEENLPRWFNTSLYTLRCVLPVKTDVLVTDTNGITEVLMKESQFLQ